MCPDCRRGELKYIGHYKEGLDYWKCDNPNCNFIGDEEEIQSLKNKEDSE
jgi:hypothetical protein